jgi:hypothetical protein
LCSFPSYKDLKNIVIPHFLRYPLKTQKHADFILFKMIVDLMNAGEHLTSEGLRKIINIKASLNLGLSELLINHFPDVTPVDRQSTVNLAEITDPN